MLKTHKTTVILTSIVILLPILMGLFLWNRLPEQMPSHWNAQGDIDGYTSRAFSVFAIPAILLAAQWVCILATGLDPKNKGKNARMQAIVLWIIPVLCLILHTIVYLTALGMAVQVEIVLPLIFGLGFTILGNFMPKTQQNSTIGIKLPWTLSSEENWNKTHRLAGWLWVVGGIVIMVPAFLGLFWIFFLITLAMVLIPTVYSYVLYRKAK